MASSEPRGIPAGVAIAGSVSVGGVVAPEPDPAPPAAASTVIVPVIDEWILQWYGNDPAVENVAVPVPLLPIVPVSNDPSSAVAVCAVASEFDHVTVSPTVTVMLDGENANPEIANA